MKRHLTLAERALDRDDTDAALRHLVAAWRERPAPALAAVIARLEAARPRATPTNYWEVAALAQKQDPAALRGLRGASIHDATYRVQHLGVLGRDPRVGDALAALLRDLPYVSDASKPLWRAVFAQLRAQNDPRSVALAAELAPTWRLRAAMRSFLTKGIADAVAPIADAHPAPPALEGDDAAALARIDARTRAPEEPPRPPDRTLDSLLADVHARPLDDGARQVLADWLTEREDVRGEFIQLQLRGGKDAAARRREREILDAHAAEWIGPIAAVLAKGTAEFRKGFLGAATVRFRHERDVVAYGSDPAWATVEELTWQVPGTPAKGQERFYEHVDPVMRGLRVARGLGPAGLSNLLERGDAPWAIESLDVAIDDLALAARFASSARFPSLRRLRLRETPSLKWLRRATFARALEALEVHAVVKLDELPGLLRALPSLRELAIGRHGFVWLELARDARRDVKLTVTGGAPIDTAQLVRSLESLPEDLATEVVVAWRERSLRALTAREREAVATAARRQRRARRLDLRAIGGADEALTPRARGRSG